MAIVAFLDLLGFSKMVETTWGRPDSVLSIVLDLKDRLRTYAADPIRIRFQSDQGRMFNCLVRSVSDSIIVATALPEDHDALDLLGAVLAVRSQIMQAVSFAAEQGFAVRGAVELGPLYWDDDDVIGPAFNTAYGLESRVADIARVIVGPRLSKAIAENPPTGYDYVLTSDLYRSGDGLCAVLPFARDVQRFVEMQKASGPASYKYDELVAVLSRSERPAKPTRPELKSIASETEAKMIAAGISRT